MFTQGGNLPDVIRHPGLPPAEIRLTVSGDLRVGLVVRLVFRDSPGRRVDVLDDDGAEEPDAPGAVAEVRPAVVNPEVAEVRVAHPPESPHDVTGHDDRFGNIGADPVPRVGETRAPHVLDGADQGLIPALSAGHHVIAEGGEERVHSRPVAGDHVRPPGQGVPRAHVHVVGDAPVLFHDLLVLADARVIAVHGGEHVSVQPGSLVNAVQEPGQALRAAPGGSDNEEVAEVHPFPCALGVFSQNLMNSRRCQWSSQFSSPVSRSLLSPGCIFSVFCRYSSSVTADHLYDPDSLIWRENMTGAVIARTSVHVPPRAALLLPAFHLLRIPMPYCPGSSSQVSPVSLQYSSRALFTGGSSSARCMSSFVSCISAIPPGATLGM
jgi:hypothetical protein